METRELNKTNTKEISNDHKETNFVFLIFYSILFLTIFITDLVYFNAPHKKIDEYIENFYINQITNNSKRGKYYYLKEALSNYKVISSFQKFNYIKCELNFIKNSTELKTQETKINNRETINHRELENNLTIFFIFSINKLNVKIFNSEKVKIYAENNSHSNMHDFDSFSEFDYLFKAFNQNQNYIYKDSEEIFVSESNIGVRIFNFPFDFIVYRKDFGQDNIDQNIIVDTRMKSSININNLDFSLSTYFFSFHIPEIYDLFGLDTENNYLKIGKKFEFSNFRNNSKLKSNESVSYSGLPILLGIDENSTKPFGLVTCNSLPLKVEINYSFVNFSFENEIIDFTFFIGKSPKEVIERIQNKFGLPTLPKFSSINWQVFGDIKFESSYNNGQKFKSNEPNFKQLFINRFVKSLNGQKIGFVLLDDNNFQNISSTDYSIISKAVNLLLKTNSSNNTSENINKVLMEGYSSISLTISIAKSMNYSMLKNFYLNEKFKELNNELHIDEKLLTYILVVSIPKEVLDVELSNMESFKFPSWHLYELKALFKYVKSKIDRPLIFSKFFFLGSQKYAGNYLKISDFTYDGMMKSLFQTIKHNILGNPHIIHEACPGLKEIFNKKDIHYKHLILCTEWLAMISLFSHARVDEGLFDLIEYLLKNFYATYKGNSTIYFDSSDFYADQLNSIFFSLNLRMSLSVYLYSYFIKMALEGGSLIRPLFLDFNVKSDNFKYKNQFMVGSNIMVHIKFQSKKIIPEIIDYDNNRSFYSNELRNNIFDFLDPLQIETDDIFFPSAPFYNFFTGDSVNRNITTQSKHDRKINFPINLFLRGGLITPFQNLDLIQNITNKNNFREKLNTFYNYTNHGASFFNENFLHFVPNLNSLKNKPFQIIVALDSNIRATGRILLDDGITTDTINKKMYYKMEVVASIINDNFVISFHVNSFKYKPKEYPCINEVIIYGFSRISVKKVSIISKLYREDIPKSNYKFEESKDILKIINIEIKMDSDSKLVIY